ncbi:unnamed protein product [Soboliphyme baturini]|uniref:Ion_trans_2 domain-containing protein n=1 Tax=Soboliphyme baturini TaxID=241478 RepID=A0A183IX88_9BILA|nr:unnamed protein product [Soboliphyme baturini]
MGLVNEIKQLVMLAYHYARESAQTRTRIPKAMESLLSYFVISSVSSLGFGVLLFRYLEGWDLLDALYFSFVTLSSIGFGDIVPANPGHVIFSIVYILCGISMLSLIFDDVESEISSWICCVVASVLPKEKIEETPESATTISANIPALPLDKRHRE